MTREEAYQFIKLYRQFQAECPNVKITDIDPSCPLIEIQTPNARKWLLDWKAAKVMET